MLLKSSKAFDDGRQPQLQGCQPQARTGVCLTDYTAMNGFRSINEIARRFYYTLDIQSCIRWSTT
ncbi:hypothetical protein O9992_21300 [Vibrio lentus]|nr:hypothetical protein [Vibrio lentus]